MRERFAGAVFVGGVLAGLGFTAKQNDSMTWAIILWCAAFVAFWVLVLPPLIPRHAARTADGIGAVAAVRADGILHKRPVGGVPSIRFGLGSHGSEQYVLPGDGLRIERVQFIEPVRRTVSKVPTRVRLWPRFWRYVDVVNFTRGGVVLTDHGLAGTAVEFRYWNEPSQPIA